MTNKCRASMTTRTVISILPLATFHQWLITLVDCSALRANLTHMSLLLFFYNSYSNSNENLYCLKKVTCFCVCVIEWLKWLFWCILLRKNQSTLYGTFTVLHFQYSWTRIMWLLHCFSFGKLNCTGWTTSAPKGWMLEGLNFSFFLFLYMTVQQMCTVKMHDMGGRIQRTWRENIEYLLNLACGET